MAESQGQEFIPKGEKRAESADGAGDFPRTQGHQDTLGSVTAATWASEACFSSCLSIAGHRGLPAPSSPSWLCSRDREWRKLARVHDPGKGMRLSGCFLTTTECLAQQGQGLVSHTSLTTAATWPYLHDGDSRSPQKWGTGERGKQLQ